MHKQLAHRYARGLMEAAGEQNASAAVESDIRRMLELFEFSPELPPVMLRASRIPEISQETVRDLTGYLKPCAITVKLLNLLLARRRLYLLPEIAQNYSDELKKRNGIAKAIVTSVRTLDPDETVLIQQRLNALSSKDVEIHWSVDRSILGGISIRMEDRVFDGSLKSRIKQLQEKLIQA
jgi:F-type H+-transporting ATPase subunit delta